MKMFHFILYYRKHDTATGEENDTWHFFSIIKTKGTVDSKPHIKCQFSSVPIRRWHVKWGQSDTWHLNCEGSWIWRVILNLPLFKWWQYFIAGPSFLFYAVFHILNRWSIFPFYSKRARNKGVGKNEVDEKERRRET